MNVFTHKPKRNADQEVLTNPATDKPMWDRVWAEAKKQPWYEDGLGLVFGTKDGDFYFQKDGCKTGFAVVRVSDQLT